MSLSAMHQLHKALRPALTERSCPSVAMGNGKANFESLFCDCSSVNGASQRNAI